MTATQRRVPIGAETVPGGVHFRVWAPGHREVEVVLEGTPTPQATALSPEEDGYFSGFCSEAKVGSRYRYRLDGADSFPDPASRFQPEGPHGPSLVVDPASFTWSDEGWPGVEREGQVIYEMHLGTYTMEGTWRTAAEQLPALKELGVTLVEVMPVADFPGRFGWGYDGVNHFAPTRLYGQPDDMRRFVDRAHALGLGVMLDVVYNHFGPEGNYLAHFSEFYYGANESDWGKVMNFDGRHNAPVREFFIANAAYWIDEFHLDGLRFDATHAIIDNSDIHILGDITRGARESAKGRRLLLVAENEGQDYRCLRPREEGGFGMDAVWNDDFHHSAHVALTGYHDAYYSEYLGSPQEMISCAKWSYLYQGQFYFWQGKRRGSPTLGISPNSYINYIQNHDQIGNSAWGTRIDRLTNPAALRAMTAVLFLLPQTPMIFQGQEFSASAPFLYFADLSSETSQQVHAGRIEFLKQFTNVDSPEVIDTIDKPYELETFQQSRIDLRERERHHKVYALYRDLIRLRREDPVFNRGYACHIEGAVLGRGGFLLRYFLGEEQRLFLVNLGRELHLAPIPEPMLAPPLGCTWEMLWSSEKVEFGGSGTPKLDMEKFWRLQGYAALVLIPVPEGGNEP
ncbi:malto-oligosyltrehalose trehalohydrolase [Geomonas nitrogeniifigens]|uniref:Malto-oligosyltrehalose trehalohydrolase n=1 Tax=Geomonas diazotrophica TaxID=2843197 RepID=A0ABX8JFD2_9BACT|nr:malto-oligosyltrehalose trehalohydrolase [Geomonas nitrogeniifigens]QWV95902.1 malto-oligosyltrehalose trehalohydrolase [Geomonas nitrogeniifigens]QXE84988.1 malto-oligosyltrehalose trehalohydrolase [Geomonas nitrogeniifigens]